MDQSKIEEAMENLLTSPKEVEVDGQRVTNQGQAMDANAIPTADIIKAANYLASKNALKGRKLPIRITKMASGGGAI